MLASLLNSLILQFFSMTYMIVIKYELSYNSLTTTADDTSCPWTAMYFSYIGFLSYTACRPDEFRCYDGTCIPGDWVCNNIQNCPFNEDEVFCPGGTDYPGTDYPGGEAFKMQNCIKCN